jgi:antitoxin component YwqK of YwqJK toxin-antitoxin module
MKTPFILFLTFIAQICLGQDTIFFDAKWKPSTRENSEFLRIDRKTDGKWTRNDYFSKTMQLQMKGSYSSLDPEIEDGYFEWFHSNSKLKHKGNYEQGKEVGVHLWFNPNGNLEAKETYKNGLLNGDYEEYYPNGKLMDKSSFIDGKQDGWTVYFRETGSKQSEGNFKNGHRDGEWKFFTEKGDLDGTTIFKIEYEIPEAKLFIQLPNDEWSLTNKSDNGLIQYIFKRNEITDSLGRTIIPAIMLYIEDAKKFDQDLVQYSITKRMAFKSVRLKVDSIMTPSHKNYPIPFKNSLITLTSYSDKGFDHILFMIHIITKENKGIQLYMDMTKELVPEYEQEFWTTLKSLKELE